MADEEKNLSQEAIIVHLKALEDAKKALDQNVSDAIESLHRIAHSVKGTCSQGGFAKAASAAHSLERASSSDYHHSLENLLKELQEVLSTGHPDKIGILIVDDDPEISRLLQSKLTVSNREIFIADTAASAEWILEEKSVSLILLNLILPDMDGRSFLMRLREHPRTAGIPVFILSGTSGTHPKTECFALGADEFFEKPINVDSITAAVASKLQKVAEIAKESRHDPLTDLPNRAAFIEAFERSQALAKRLGEPLSLAILDFDGFKAVNDIYGHSIGDEVLSRASAAISGALRSSDLVARWGGDEFVVLFPNTNEQGSLRALEKALEAVRSEQFQTPDGRMFQISFSAGIKTVRSGVSVKNAVNQADMLLYRAKAEGGNKIFCPSEEVSAPKKKVMLAEDEEFIASIVRHHLEQEGFEVFHFENGQKAFDAASGLAVSIAILDVNMPLMDGFELLQRLRKIPTFSRTPIVMLTSMGSEKDIAKGLDLGADDYILKPFSAVEFMARVRRLLRRR